MAYKSKDEWKGDQSNWKSREQWERDEDRKNGQPELAFFLIKLAVIGVVKGAKLAAKGAKQAWQWGSKKLKQL